MSVRRAVAADETGARNAAPTASLDAPMLPQHDLADTPPRWLYITLPTLAIDLIERQSPVAAPRVVVDGPELRASVFAANAAALATGIQPGMRLPAAQALAALTVHRRDPLAENKALEHLAGFAYRYTSRVALDTGLTLEIGASLQLFGGFLPLHAALTQGFVEQGFAAQFGYGDSPSAARLRSTAARERHAPLGAIPLTSSTLDPRVVSTLAATGVHTHGELARLPRSGVARRFGQRVIDYLSRLHGELPEALTLYRPPDRYHAWWELPAPSASIDTLAYPIKRLLADLAAQLAARDGGVERFTLRFALEKGFKHRTEIDQALDSDVVRIDVGLLEASRDPERLFALTRARLEHFKLPRAVLGIHLEVSRLPTFTPTASDLFDDPGVDKTALKPLLERLSARLGTHSLKYPRLLADHRMEFAQLWENTPKASTVKPGTAPRPAWLLLTPVRIQIADFRLVSSAERIEGGWWDDRDQRRDYYLAEVIRARKNQAVHARAFVFQDLKQSGQWYLHGWV